MINTNDILETITMIQDENLDVRTITMGISLLDCCDSDMDKTCARVYDKITRYAKDLVRTGEDIEKEYGIPIINKRISVTPIAMILAACERKDSVKLAVTLEKAAQACGVNFIGGFSALVQKGFSPGDRELIESIPEALAVHRYFTSDRVVKPRTISLCPRGQTIRPSRGAVFVSSSPPAPVVYRWSLVSSTAPESLGAIFRYAPS